MVFLERTYVLLQMFIYFLFCHGISELHWSIGMKFCTVVCTRLNFKNWAQKFGGALPKKNSRVQKRAKFGPNSDDFKVRRLISPEGIKIFIIGQVRQQPQFLPCSTKKCGELWSRNFDGLEAKSYPPNRLIRKTIFPPLSSAVPPNFYMR